MKYSMKQPKDLNDYYHSFNSDNIQYYESLKNFLSLSLKAKGDILEFGIGRGRSLIATCHLINELKIKKKLIAFDSFQGFDFINEKDNSFRRSKKNDWSSSPKGQFKYSEQSLKKVINKHIYKNNFKKVIFIKGYVEETLPNYIKNIKSISFINLDLDLYSGHKTVLENTFEKLSKNGIIYFDDIMPGVKLKNSPFPGAYLSFKEFFQKKKIKKFTCKFRGNLIIQKI